MTKDILIIGASQAGVELAASLREFNAEDRVTLVGAETFSPYQRPPLSKSLHASDAIPPAMQLRLPSFFASQGITLRLGERIVEVDHERRRALADSGRTYHYSKLALTVGARARKLRVPGWELEGITCLRSYTDASRLAKNMETAQNVIVVGAGLIGMEFAALARRCGKAVKVVEVGTDLMQRVASPAVSRFVREKHISSGVEILFGRTVKEFEGRNGSVERAVLDDGASLPADVVVVGIGSEPRTELAEAIGIERKHGIVVDRHARTSVAGIVAAGDCTVERSVVPGGAFRRLESVSNAIGQAKIAAASLSGAAARRPISPWFWSDQGEVRLQSVGRIGDANEHEIVEGAANDRLVVRHFLDSVLVAVECVNCPGEFLAARRQLNKLLADGDTRTGVAVVA